MKTYARIVGGIAVDVTAIDPKTIFHPDLADTFVEVPTGTADGDRKDGNAWVKFVPAQLEPEAPKPPTVTPPQFKLLMLADLPDIAEKAKTDITVATFLDVVNDPRLTEVDLSLTSVQNGVKYCLKQIGRTDLQIETRMSAILSGVWT